MQPENHPFSKYTKIIAIIVLVGIVPALSFYIGTQFQTTVDVISAEPPKHPVADYSEYYFPLATTKTFVSKSLGISFEYNPSDWNVESDANETVVLKGLGEYKDDLIDIKKRTVPFTIDDVKFGPTSFSYDEGAGVWMIDPPESGVDGSNTRAKEAVAVMTTQSGIPVYPSTGRWKTYVLPIADQTMISVHITGSGITEPLDPITRSIKKLD